MVGDEDSHFRLRYQDPFAAPPDARRPLRQLRGRMAAPVTIWTSGGPSRHAGLTVSSVLVADGEPGVVIGLVSPLSDLHERIVEVGTFTVNLLEEGDRRLADAFAGAYPVDPFQGLEVIDSPWGPVLGGPRSSASCRYTGSGTVGYHELVQGTIEEVRLSPRGRPLVHHRARYWRLADDR